MKQHNCRACGAVLPTLSHLNVGDTVKCHSCGTKMVLKSAKSKQRESTNEFDIHPALAKRYRDIGSDHSNREPTGDVGQPAQQKRVHSGRPRFPDIPGYRILDIVGKGAMGQVYKAVFERTDQLAAVKVLAPNLASRPDFIARFEREAAALDAVEHPGVVPILERGQADDLHFLSMPFVEGVSLRRLMPKGGLPALRAIRYARQIAQALGAAHDKQVVHRDLKPENILVQETPDEFGTYHEILILVDFGLAGMGDDDPHPNLTKSRMTMGTVNYMAPEQRTDAKRVGPEADIYALGVIFYEMLTGDLPLGRFHLPTERPGLGHLPKSLDKLISKILQQDVSKRYRSIPELEKDFKKIEAALRRQSFSETVVGRASGVPLEKPNQLATSPEHVTQPPYQAFQGEQKISDVLSGTSGPSSETGSSLSSMMFAQRQIPWMMIFGVAALCSLLGIFWLMESKSAPEEEVVVEKDDVKTDTTVPEDKKSLSVQFPNIQWIGAGWELDESDHVVAHTNYALRQEPSLAIFKNNMRESIRFEQAIYLPPEGAGGVAHMDLAYGGIHLLTEERAYGVVVSTKGECFFFQVDESGQNDVRPLSCQASDKHRLSLACDRSEGIKCVISIDDVEKKTFVIDGDTGSSWRPALVCHRTTCQFDKLVEE